MTKPGSDAVKGRHVGDGAREPYVTPRLLHYGSIASLTQTSGGTMGMNDMGAGFDKTAF